MRRLLLFRSPAGCSAEDQGGDPPARGEQRGRRHGRPRDDPAPGRHPQRLQW